MSKQSLTTSAPSKEIINAFNLKGLPKLLSGGQGMSWVVGDGVIKPAGEETETKFIADTMNTIEEKGFRVARPIKAANGSWIYNGWVACNLVQGSHVSGRWEEKIAVCRSFHQALAQFPKPTFLSTRTHRYAVADKIAWGELPLNANTEIQQYVESLQKLIQPIDSKNQLIHGDITGNMLFAEGLAPAIIDFSPYWRPADYAIAIMVMDALVWENADESLLEQVATIKDIYQLLLRALIGRIMQFDGLMKESGVSKLKEIEAHKPFSETLMKLLKE